MFRFRVEKDEKEAFERAARLAGLSASGWARTRLRQLAAEELTRVGKSVPFLKNED